MAEKRTEYLQQLGKEIVGIDAYEWATDYYDNRFTGVLYAISEFLMPANLRLFSRDEVVDMRIVQENNSNGCLIFGSSCILDVATNAISFGAGVGVALATKDITFTCATFLSTRLLFNGITHLTVDGLKKI